MKKLIFLTSFDYPSRFAHPVHGLEMATAFCNIFKKDFLFVVNTVIDKSELNNIQFTTPFGQYGRNVKKMHLRLLGYFFWLPLFFLRNKAWRRNDTMVFLNDPMLAVVTILLRPFLGYRVVFESHGEYSAFHQFIIFHFAHKLIFVTHGLFEEAKTRHSCVKEKGLVLSNAVEVERFVSEKTPVNKLRERLKLPVTSFIIGYIGRLKPLGVDKGVSLMIESLKELPDSVCALFVGGIKKEIEEYTLLASSIGVLNRVFFVEHINKNDIPKYTKSCNLLVYVPDGGGRFFQKETSPMKLFEYMASERLIIASDMPSTREILDDSSAILIRPGNKVEFIKGVKIIMEDDEVVSNKVRNAFTKVKKNTWGNRVRKIIELI